MPDEPNEAYTHLSVRTVFYKAFLYSTPRKYRLHQKAKCGMTDGTVILIEENLLSEYAHCYHPTGTRQICK